MADRDIIIGRAINVTGMIGVPAGIVLFTFGLVLLLFRRGFGFDIKFVSLVLVAGHFAQVRENCRVDRGNRTYSISTPARYVQTYKMRIPMQGTISPSAREGSLNDRHNEFHNGARAG